MASQAACGLPVAVAVFRKPPAMPNGGAEAADDDEAFLAGGVDGLEPLEARAHLEGGPGVECVGPAHDGLVLEVMRPCR